MNALKKAHLVKELHELIQQLEHQALPLYDVARFKKRIRDIFNLCDDSIIKDYILSFKFQYQINLAVNHFSASFNLHLSFCFYYTKIPDLEKSLYTLTDIGWAILHHPK